MDLRGVSVLVLACGLALVSTVATGAVTTTLAYSSSTSTCGQQSGPILLPAPSCNMTMKGTLTLDGCSATTCTVTASSTATFSFTYPGKLSASARLVLPSQGGPLLDQEYLCQGQAAPLAPGLPSLATQATCSGVHSIAGPRPVDPTDPHRKCTNIAISGEGDVNNQDLPLPGSLAFLHYSAGTATWAYFFLQANASGDVSLQTSCN